MEKAGTLIANAVQQIKEASERIAYRFDVFKGVVDSEGRVVKVKSVGYAQISEGGHTYALHLKTFLKDQFFMLPERTHADRYDFVILTREDSFREGRKYFWNNVGEGKILSGTNEGLMKLNWDLLSADDVYLNLNPIKKVVSGQSQAASPDAVAA
jgi:hypothetical protein